MKFGRHVHAVDSGDIAERVPNDPAVSLAGLVAGQRHDQKRRRGDGDNDDGDVNGYFHGDLSNLIQFLSKFGPAWAFVKMAVGSGFNVVWG